MVEKIVNSKKNKNEHKIINKLCISGVEKIQENIENVNIISLLFLYKL